MTPTSSAPASALPSSSVPAAETLAAYAVGLRFSDLPANAVTRARHCLIDAVACAVFGSTLPWSRIVADYVYGMGASGPCRLAGALPEGLPPAQAALCLGAFAHAFELDSLRQPSAGAHPGAVAALPALAMAQATGASGRDLLAAIVAGCEVMFRIGKATLHTREFVGFHAPGIIGPFGAAVVTGRLLGLSAEQLADAFGISGSLTGGLLAFAKSGQGGMIKRLHLGRAAEAGVTAAYLAGSGFEGPRSVIDGKFGVLDAFCEATEPALLTEGLGTRYEIDRACIKRYACHATAQIPVELLGELMREHRFDGDAIAAIDLTVSAKVVSHHAERRPADVMLGQYSVPFSLALSAYRDPENPASFDASALADTAIIDLADRIALLPGPAIGWGATMSVRLHDGRTFTAAGESFRGSPDKPAADSDIERKFWKLVAPADHGEMVRLLDYLKHIENLDDCSVLAESTGKVTSVTKSG